MSKYFQDLIGQDAVKKKLSFYLDAFNKTGLCPFLNLIGAKGLGKTEFAKALLKPSIIAVETSVLLLN